MHMIDHFLHHDTFLIERPPFYSLQDEVYDHRRRPLKNPHRMVCGSDPVKLGVLCRYAENSEQRK